MKRIVLLTLALGLSLASCEKTETEALCNCVKTTTPDYGGQSYDDWYLGDCSDDGISYLERYIDPSDGSRYNKITITCE